MVLIDTSAWVHQLRRKGDPVLKQKVEAELHAGEAVWCPIVRLELWAGVGVDPERDVLRHYEQVLPELSMDEEVWQIACDLADESRRKGYRVPSPDLLVAACARHHKVRLLANDAHFDFLMQL
jgi:predicted nucleic acid-binding protein